MRKSVPFLFVGLFLAGSLCAQAADTDQGMQSGDLWSGCWEISLLGHHSSGRFCWLDDPDQGIRVEVSRESVPETCPEAAHGPWQDFLHPLFYRRGPGWTAVLGPDQSGALQAWGREWQSIQPALGVWIKTRRVRWFLGKIQ